MPAPLRPIRRLLVANRGEIAVRIARGAAELGIETVAIHTTDDARNLHVRMADRAVALPGEGARGYLDVDAVVAAAQEAGCDAVHPGYGFLSENAGLARALDAAGITFVGPRPETLELFGDKARARAFAAECDVPTLPGTEGPATVEELRAFMAAQNGAPIVIKAVAGGGGRGMRVVRDPAELPELYERCTSEAKAFFGDPAVYGERLVEHARHVEVQIVGDGTGAVVHLHDRDCTLQRRHQKLVEVAPAPAMPAAVRQQLFDGACRMAERAEYLGLGTVEFLVEAPRSGEPLVAFIEANPRIQVEHTITEEVTGVDLVRSQLRLLGGASLQDVGLATPPAPRGHAVQVRVNLEVQQPDGSVRPSTGTLEAFEPPRGPGVRVDTFGYTGYRTSPHYDSLLAKVIVHDGASLDAAFRRAYRALTEFRVEGVKTNLPFLLSLLTDPGVRSYAVHTRFVDEHARELLQPEYLEHPRHWGTADEPAQGRAGSGDPLAVLRHASAPGATAPVAEPGPDGSEAVCAPMQGTVVAVEVAQGDRVRAGQQLVVLEAMKMEHPVTATVAGEVVRVDAAAGGTVPGEAPLVWIAPADSQDAQAEETLAVDPDHVRPDLEEVLERHAIGRDERRPEAVERRHGKGKRTARENLDDLLDPGTYIEYAPLVVAPQRRRRSMDDLIRNTPADGMIAGVGHVNGHLFDEDASRAVVMSYDYTVLAGTQGGQNHRKKDRLFEIARHNRLPVVFFTEGGGGRPGDTDGLGVAGLDCLAFQYWAMLSGLVPLVGIGSGYCFAGNAAILGCCDVVIATEDANIGMGGPAMIEGGGLGQFSPKEIGPVSEQLPNGVIDVLVKDEAEAVQVAKKYLSYFQGPLAHWTVPDQRVLRHLIPENRLRVYEIRDVIHQLADEGSVLELRESFGVGMVTALARFEGRPVGIVANNPRHLGGAIDAPAADKAARFMQLCDAFDIPLLFLCDTPGFMVGPDAERTALVRHVSRMFVTAASMSVPFFTIVLRKGYGLGAQSMAGGSFKAPFFLVSWPTGEFGGMGLEGAVKLGYRKELEAIEDPEERQKAYEARVARMYEHGKALSAASVFEIDDVIDPADSRHWILAALKASPKPPPREGKKRPCVDTW